MPSTASGAGFRRLALEDGAILYDPAALEVAGPELFDRARWRTLGALTEQRGGRGSISFIEDRGRRWALRRYLRGGLAAHVSRERYLYLGEARTRSFRELRLLGELVELGLPVPAPVAACYRRRGLSYEAELLTRRLPASVSLANALLAGKMDTAAWEGVGRCLRRFHDAGVRHADLNAHNVMLGDNGAVWLLDFDRGCRRRPGRWRNAVLARLERSLAKVTAGRDQGWREGFQRLRMAHDGVAAQC